MAENKPSSAKFRVLMTVALLIILAGCYMVYVSVSPSAQPDSTPASDPNGITIH